MLYKRILLKLSGEFLAGKDSGGINSKILKSIAKQLAYLSARKIETGIVVGGGNLVRGEQIAQVGLDRVAGDQMGMLATAINGIALRDALEKEQIKVKLVSAVPIGGMLEGHNPRDANRFLSEGEVVIFCGGTGNPYFTTDTASCLRAIEIKADIMLKGTKVDGIYSSDPIKDPSSKKFNRLTYKEVIDMHLKVMDFTAITLARDHQLPVRVFNITQPEMLINVMQDSATGTLIIDK